SQLSRPVASGGATVTPPTPPSSFVGVLLPPQMANLSPRTDGRLVELAVKVGDRVQKGALLATFDARERRHDLAIAEAQLKGARGAAASAGADYAAARSKATRRSEGLVSREDAEQSAFDARSAGGRAASAAAQVAEQRAKVAQLKLALQELELRAPYDGIVTALYFESGMSVHANETTVRVVGVGRGLRVRVAIPEEAHDR